MLQGRRGRAAGLLVDSPANGNHGLVSDAIQTLGGVPPGRRSWPSARGPSPLLVTARIAGPLLVRREVQDKVVATVGAVGRSGFLRTGHGLAAIAGVLTLILLYRRNYSIARHFAVVAVAPFVAGWGVA